MFDSSYSVLDQEEVEKLDDDEEELELELGLVEPSV
jgi:hypothetical protein